MPYPITGANPGKPGSLSSQSRRLRASLVKRTQTFHAFTTLVPERPLEYLWTPAGYWTPHERTRALSATEVDALLSGSNDYRLVEAKTGAELRWYLRGDYGFWHHHAKLHMRELIELPQQWGYAASEWLDTDTGDGIILHRHE